jgi:hypothetical protein
VDELRWVDPEGTAIPGQPVQRWSKPLALRHFPKIIFCWVWLVAASENCDWGHSSGISKISSFLPVSQSILIHQSIYLFIHLYLSILFVYLSISLSSCLSVYLSICLPIMCPSVHPSIHLYLSVHSSVRRSTHALIGVSVLCISYCLFIYKSIYPCIYFSVYYSLAVCLSSCLSLCLGLLSLFHCFLHPCLLTDSRTDIGFCINHRVTSYSYDLDTAAFTA